MIQSAYAPPLPRRPSRVHQCIEQRGWTHRRRGAAWGPFREAVHSLQNPRQPAMSSAGATRSPRADGARKMQQPERRPTRLQAQPPAARRPLVGDAVVCRRPPANRPARRLAGSPALKNQPIGPSSRACPPPRRVASANESGSGGEPSPAASLTPPRTALRWQCRPPAGTASLSPPRRCGD